MPPRGAAIELLGHARIGGIVSVGIANGSWAPRFIPLDVAPLSGRDANPDEDHDQSILIESIELEVGGASIEFKWNELGRRSTTLV